MTETLPAGKEIRAPDYLGGTFEPSDRVAVLIRNRNRGETVQRIASAARIADPSFQQWLHHKNQVEGFDVYIGMNPLKPASRSRTKEDVLTIRHLYLDLDRSGPASLAAIRQSNLVPAPNYVLRTSPDKFQVIWRVEGISQENAEALLRALARRFDADPAATDSTRVLRLPGFLNRKYDQETVVTARQYADRINHGLEFKLRIDHSEAPYQSLRRGAGGAPSHGPRPLSQSEHDWAYAKRALARGANPEDVVRSIAQFREGEKSDAFDYAQRTVAKAQAQLSQETRDGLPSATGLASPADRDSGD
jgi:hypothetical protein